MYNTYTQYPGIYLLSETEWEVLIHLTNGLTSKEIAILMKLMPKSVDNYKNRIGKKLGMQGYGTLCLFAEEKRLFLQECVKLIYPELFDRFFTKVNKRNQISLEEMEIVNGGGTLPEANKYRTFDSTASINFTSIFEVKFGLF